MGYGMLLHPAWIKTITSFRFPSIRLWSRRFSPPVSQHSARYKGSSMACCRSPIPKMHNCMEAKPPLSSQNKSGYLVGGWTNPIWKICDRQIGSFPKKDRGENKTYLSCHQLEMKWIGVCRALSFWYIQEMLACFNSEIRKKEARTKIGWFQMWDYDEL